MTIDNFKFSFQNLHKSVENGVAVKVMFQTLTAAKLKDALLKILNDPR
jgi:hypothetical protein